MPVTSPPDRFDEMRRAWIARHVGESLIQRRRAEQLGRTVRSRQRRQTGAVPDPHDDTALPRIWWRRARSPMAKCEALTVIAIAALLPVGWFGGWWLKALVTRLIPGTLRGFPIAALIWSGVSLIVVTLVASAAAYDPAGSFWQATTTPWIAMQMSAIPLIAGSYGVLDGWLAVDGSEQWWPLAPTARPLTADDAAAVLGAYDLTVTGVVDARPQAEPGQRTRP